MRLINFRATRINIDPEGFVMTITTVGIDLAKCVCCSLH
jgi:hypothetical protein